MGSKPHTQNKVNDKTVLTLGFIFLILLSSCSLPRLITTVGPQDATATLPEFVTTFLPESTASAETTQYVPTPDPERTLPEIRTQTENYSVRSGDTIISIAARFGIGPKTLAEANQLENPDQISVGLELIIPPPDPMPQGPENKILPDSELVYSPSAATFEISTVIAESGGYLATYSEELDGVVYSGADVVTKVALDFSVNPRLLLALLEYQSGWLTQKEPASSSLKNPLYLDNSWRTGLYHQLIWSADNLNRGYYLWKVNGISSWVLLDEKVVPPSPQLNAGTAGLQHLLGLLYGYNAWLTAVSEQGFYKTYTELFGNPFAYGIEPLTPPNLEQPDLLLPFSEGMWAFTGGPHGAWGNGSAWGGLDFAPPGEALGCVQSNAWVTAMADGKIIRSANGVVIQDLDGDGIEQTGWSILYLHIETRDRVEAGTYLKAGEAIGHPSCEGGVSSGTHVHIARKYNGEWISADGKLPFNLEGWISSGTGIAYNGYLIKDNESIEAYAGRNSNNQIQH